MNQPYIRAFIEEDEHLIQKLYYENRDLFLNFGKRYQLPQAELLDVYQDAFVALREKALQGKLDNLKSSIRTYLFGIGKYIIYDRLKQKDLSRPLKHDPKNDLENAATVEFEINNTLSEEEKLLQKNFKKLGEKCRNMLTMFYYRGLTIDEITSLGGYNNSNVVRSQKSRCLKTLKELISSNYE